MSLPCPWGCDANMWVEQYLNYLRSMRLIEYDNALNAALYQFTRLLAELESHGLLQVFKGLLN